LVCHSFTFNSWEFDKLLVYLIHWQPAISGSITQGSPELFRNQSMPVRRLERLPAEHTSAYGRLKAIKPGGEVPMFLVV
jgi:hypothetical protein